jgi:hypothetical protein
MLAKTNAPTPQHRTGGRIILRRGRFRDEQVIARPMIAEKTEEFGVTKSYRKPSKQQQQKPRETGRIRDFLARHIISNSRDIFTIVRKVRLIQSTTYPNQRQGSIQANAIHDDPHSDRYMIGLVLMICAKSRDKGPNHRPHPWIIYLAQYLSTRAMWGWGVWKRLHGPMVPLVQCEQAHNYFPSYNSFVSHLLGVPSASTHSNSL